MKKQLLVVAAVMAGVAGMTTAVDAAEVRLGEGAPEAGSVTMDDNGKAIEASSPGLFDLAKQAEGREEGNSRAKRGVLNYNGGRWVYGTDWTWSGKKAWSNHNNYHRWHGARADFADGRGRMRNNSGWRDAGPNITAYAEAFGQRSWRGNAYYR